MPPGDSTERNERVMEMLLSGEKRKDIAKALGISRTTVWNIESSEEFQREAERRRSLRLQTLRQRFAAHADRAMEVQVELMESSNPLVRIAATKEVLKNAGIGDEVHITVDDRREVAREKLARFLAEKSNAAENDPEAL